MLIFIYGSQDKRLENVITTFISDPEAKMLSESLSGSASNMSPILDSAPDPPLWDRRIGTDISWVLLVLLSGQYEREKLLNLMAHSQLWGRGDPDTSFATLKSVYLNPKYRYASDTSRNSLQSCLVFHSIFDIFLSIVFIHPSILFYHICLKQYEPRILLYANQLKNGI